MSGPGPKLSKLLRKIRNFILTVALLAGLIAASLPGLIGLGVRHQMSALLTAASDSNPYSALLSVHLDRIEPGWFTSNYYLTLAGPVLSADGSQTATQRTQLSVTHGPIIRHLRDTPLAIAEFQLINLDPVTGPDTPHLSGSAVLTMESPTVAALRGIAGFSALGGEHWLESRGQWSLPAVLTRAADEPLPGNLQFYLDADAEALGAGAGKDLLQIIQLQGWTRISNGRALSHISVIDGAVTVNGQSLRLSVGPADGE